MRPILALNCLSQIEQERSEEESSVGDALALAFRYARFCSASFCFVFTSSPFYEVSLCWYVEVFKGGFEGVLVSLLLTTMGAFSYLKFSIEDFLWQTSGILLTWPVHLNCANFRRVCILCIPALFRTSVSRILSPLDL